MSAMGRLLPVPPEWQGNGLTIAKLNGHTANVPNGSAFNGWAASERGLKHARYLTNLLERETGEKVPQAEVASA